MSFFVHHLLGIKTPRHPEAFLHKMFCNEIINQFTFSRRALLYVGVYYHLSPIADDKNALRHFVFTLIDNLFCVNMVSVREAAPCSHDTLPPLPSKEQIELNMWK